MPRPTAVPRAIVTGRPRRELGGPAGWLPQIAALLVAIAAIATLHYRTDPSHVVLHEIYNYLCFLPIVVAASWFGVAGGVAAAAVTSAVFIPHIRAAWAGNVPYSASLYAQVIVFHVIGLTVGVLAASQRQLVARYRESAERLAQTNREMLESQERLRRADRLTALGEIAAGLAHELRSPLAAVKGACEIISSRVQPQTPEAEFSQIATKELHRLEGLVDEFLTYARPHAPALRPATLAEICHHTAALLQPESDRRAVALEIDPSVSATSVTIDPEQIAQVLLNLMLNALQASAAGSAVQVVQETEPDVVRIRVRDRGTGIAPEHLSRIFEPFFTTKEHGTGLGLAIAQQIVTAHGGRLWASSDPTTGTEFVTELPRGYPPSATSRGSTAS